MRSIVAIDGIGVLDIAILAGFVSWILLASARSALQETRRERVGAPRRERVGAPRRARRPDRPTVDRPDRRTVARRAGAAVGAIRASMRRFAIVAAGGDP